LILALKWQEAMRKEVSGSDKFNGAQPAAVRPHAVFNNEISGRPHLI